MGCMVTQMNDEIELKEALDFISPASLTYEEWTMVGMGLKEAGLPLFWSIMRKTRIWLTRLSKRGALR